jgi:hypothetical protein
MFNVLPIQYDSIFMYVFVHNMYPFISALAFGGCVDPLVVSRRGVVAVPDRDPNSADSDPVYGNIVREIA